MRVVLDTNILVSALIAPAGKPAAIYSAWVEGKFTLLIHNPRPFGGEGGSPPAFSSVGARRVRGSEPWRTLQT
jgi:hypothetical protein